MHQEPTCRWNDLGRLICTGPAAFDPANLAWGQAKRWLVNDELEPSKEVTEWLRNEFPFIRFVIALPILEPPRHYLQNCAGHPGGRRDKLP